MSLLSEVAFWLGDRAAQDAGNEGSCAVLVLGYPNARDGAYHPVQHLRVQTGVETYDANQCDRIIFSGGAVATEQVEAESMAAIARELGVSEQALVIEARARTTWENIGCSMPYFVTYDRVLIVSDSLHVHRAKRYACRQNPSRCSDVYAIAAYQPFRLSWWKAPAALYELYVRLRDFLIYEQAATNNDALCPSAPT